MEGEDAGGGFLVTKRIELEEDWWSGSWYAGGLKEVGALLVII